MQKPCDRREQSWVLGVTALASFMMALDAQVITTAFATLTLICQTMRFSYRPICKD